MYQPSIVAPGVLFHADECQTIFLMPLACLLLVGMGTEACLTQHLRGVRRASVAGVYLYSELALCSIFITLSTSEDIVSLDI